MAKKGWIIAGCLAAAGLLVVVLLAAAAGYYFYSQRKGASTANAPLATTGGPSEVAQGEETEAPASAASAPAEEPSRPSDSGGGDQADSSAASAIDDIEPDQVRDPAALDAPLIKGRPAPERQEPVRLSKPPRKTHDVAPEYPDIASSARVQGVVIIELAVDEKGRVSSARVLRSVPLLDEAALSAVRQWRYEPTLTNGRPVPVTVTVTVNFRLS
jgi:TonB family protein